MKILIDGLIYSSAPSGGGYRYFNELISRLSAFPDTEVNIFTQKNPTSLPVGVNLNIQKDTLPTGAWLPEGKIKNQLRFCKKLLKKWILKNSFSGIKDCVFHSTYYTPCPWKNIPQVTTIYDMISELFPETYDLPHIKTTREAKAVCIKNAARIITISENTKRDLEKVYDISPSSIDVIHLGVDYNIFSKMTSEAMTQQLLEKYRLNRPYFLFIGGRLHHKNFIRLLKAFALSTVRRDYVLAVAGAPWNDEETNLIKSLNLEDSIIWMPSVPEHELPTLYQNAVAFAFPSYYEGFGLPLVEAMAAGCPVVASDAGPFPELSGNAAILFDPFDEAKIARALEDVLDPTTRSRLVDLGQNRAKGFSWDELARKHLKTYHKALNA
jgi:glycosyltransferase involved in cell wall biosynthesis